MGKESDEIGILIIRGQLLSQRSPKCHLRLFSAKFSCLAPFLSIFKKSKYISDDIIGFYMISPFRTWYSFYLLDHSSIFYEFSYYFISANYLIVQNIIVPKLIMLFGRGLF